MKFLKILSLIPLFTFGIGVLSAYSYTTYQMSPSTGVDLPFSVQTKNLLKTLFDNPNARGAQVIALRDQPGNQPYSGNYIDMGDLGGIKKNDLMALFTPQGEPVGFISIVDVQRYTSSFEFLELTVDPSDALIAKRVTQEIKENLPGNLVIYPDMKHFRKNPFLASKFKGHGKKPAPPKLGSSTTGSGPTGSGQTPLPPLPSEESSTTGGSNFPPLPETGTTSSTPSSLPPLPMDNSMGAMPSSNSPAAPSEGLPPLPGGPENGSALPPATTPEGSLPALPGTPAAPSSELPSLPGNNSGFLAPAPTVEGGLPPLPTDNTNAGGLPPAPGPAGEGGLPPIPTENANPSGLPPAPGRPCLPITPACPRFLLPPLRT